MFAQLGVGDSFTRGSSASSMGDNLPSVLLAEPTASLEAHGYVTCARGFLFSGLRCWGSGSSIAQASLSRSETSPARSKTCPRLTSALPRFRWRLGSRLRVPCLPATWSAHGPRPRASQGALRRRARLLAACRDHCQLAPRWDARPCASTSFVHPSHKRTSSWSPTTWCASSSNARSATAPSRSIGPIVSFGTARDDSAASTFSYRQVRRRTRCSQPVAGSHHSTPEAAR
jgi:hypothetical protein